MTIELNEKDTNLILKGLGKLPAEESFDMILRLQMMWREQEEAKKEEKAE